MGAPSAQRFRRSRPLSGWAAGRRIYDAVFALQAVLIALITPALTAGAITLEREQRAYEMLVMTQLRPMEVVAGKLAAALAFVALLLTSSLPLLSLSFFFGGVSPGERAAGLCHLLQPPFVAQQDLEDIPKLAG